MTLRVGSRGMGWRNHHVSNGSPPCCVLVGDCLLRMVCVVMHSNCWSNNWGLVNSGNDLDCNCCSRNDRGRSVVEPETKVDGVGFDKISDGTNSLGWVGGCGMR